MKRVALALGLLLLLLLLGIPSYAAEDLAPLCWKANEFADVFRAEVTYNPDAQPDAYGMFMAPLTAVEWIGPFTYTLRGTGVWSVDYPSYKSFTIDVNLANRSTFWANGAPNLAFTATLDANRDSPGFLGGPWTIRGWGMPTGGSTPYFFQVSGTMTLVSCEPEATISRAPESMGQSGALGLAGQPK